MRKTSFVFLVFLILFLSSCTNLVEYNPTQEKSFTLELENREIQTTVIGTKYLVHPSNIESGGPPKDGIPSINNPKFVTVHEADAWINDQELVLAINYKGEKHVYPLQILVWHEIINDNIKGDPILITYCPLCGSGLAYHGYLDIDGKKIESKFGTSGKLYNSNLIMYDNLSNTYWSQIDGIAIVGKYAGKTLKEIDIDTITWRDYKKQNPNAKVLSQETGYNKAYGKDPYQEYYKNLNLLFDVENKDSKLHPKTIVYGIKINNVSKAYQENDLKKLGVIRDIVGGKKIRIERDEFGIINIQNLDNGNKIIKKRMFWFCWFTFHPNTLLFKNN